MTAEELRALTAQGPAVVMCAREDMLKLLDERDRLREFYAAQRSIDDAGIFHAHLKQWERLARARAALEPRR